VLTEGGPPIVLPRAVVKHWRGSDARRGEEQTDYDRACAVDDWVGTIDVKGVSALVLGDEPLASWWFPGVPGEAGCLVRPSIAPDDQQDDDEGLVSLVERVPTTGWKRLLTWDVPAGGLTLFDSVYRRSEADTAQDFDLAPGRYSVSLQKYTPSGWELYLYWVKPAKVR
jgi:hypothetical protein